MQYAPLVCLCFVVVERQEGVLILVIIAALSVSFLLMIGFAMVCVFNSVAGAGNE